MKFQADFARGRVLIVAEDTSSRREVRVALAECGFEIATASTAEEALMRLRRLEYDIVLLNPSLPEVGCVEACRRIRNEFSTVWIVVLAAHDRVEDGIELLDAGADHYINEPFHGRELGARVRAVVRRVRITVSQSRKPIRIGSVYLDLAKRVVVREGREIGLTTTEFHLLYQLMASAGRPVPYHLLLDVIWGRHTSKERVYLRIYICHLRKKLEVQPTRPRLLLTHLNAGYVFADPASEA
jgi:two-component system, OmpR family, KDP operon response regulator KdpE